MNAPTVVALRLHYEHATVTFVASPFSKWGGVLVPGGATRIHATPDQKQQLRAWRAIQKERARLKLPPLASEEMEIV